MAYVTYEFYTSLYGDSLTEANFNRLLWEAERKVDIATTGVDNIKKLRVAFPTDEDDAETVKRCVCKLMQVMQEIKEAEDAARQASGYSKTENGLVGKIISSISAGTESISYSTGSSKTETMIDKALSDPTAQAQLFNDIILEYLSGVADANGVTLLYMGRYPMRLEV